MNARRIFLGDTEFRLMAVAAYALAAFSVAALVQILSSGSARPESFPYLARMAFTAGPLLAAGLALDFYCVGRPKMVAIGSVLVAVIGLLLGFCATAMGTVLGAYSMQVADYISMGLWGGVVVLVAASVGSWLVDV